MCAAKNTDKNADEKRTMGIQLTEDQIQRLKAYCHEEDRSIAWFVRLAVNEWLDKKDRERSANPLTPPAKRGA